MNAEIFCARLTRELTADEQAILYDCLPPERRERFSRLRSPAGRSEILCAYGLLRVALWGVLGWRTLPAVALSEHGKPFFPDFPGVQFSLSHTEGAVMVGVSCGPIGVDIQKGRPIRARLARRVAGSDDPETFFRVWVSMEAAGKRDGHGLAPILHAGASALSDTGYTALETWPGYFAGVALGSGGVPMKIHFYTV